MHHTLFCDCVVVFPFSEKNLIKSVSLFLKDGHFTAYSKRCSWDESYIFTLARKKFRL